MSRLPALGLALLLLAGGVSPAEWVLLALLVLAAALPAAEPAPQVSDRVLALLTGAATLAFVVTASALPVQDQPLGQDWYRYLRNALAVATGDWELWHAWRGPAHAWATVALVPLTGNLVDASQLLSLVAVAGCLPLTALLVRRHHGALPALLAVLLLAAWPDLRLFARTSTPYPLLALTSTAGAVLLGRSAAAEARRAWAWAGAGALVLGVGVATDLRGTALALAVALGAAAAGDVRRWLPLVGGGAGLALGQALLAAHPVELVSLAEQVGLQRDLNATGQLATCTVAQGAFPTPAELVGACARATAWDALGRAQAAVPVSVYVLFGLVGLGLVAGLRPDRPRWGVTRLAPLVLPWLPLLPTVVLVQVVHRYLLPVAPVLAALGALGLARAARGRPVVAVALVVGLMGAWNLHPGTLLARAQGAPRPAGAATVLQLGQLTGVGRFAQALRREARAGERIVDCARGGMAMRLYPLPVDEVGAGQVDRLPGPCRALLATPPAASTWLVVPYREAPSGWTVVDAFDRGDVVIGLLHAGAGQPTAGSPSAGW